MKNRILMASLVAGISLCGLGAFAQENGAEPNTRGPRGPGGPGGPGISFSAFDLNGDGSISEAEFNQARADRQGRGPGFRRDGTGPQRGPGRLAPSAEEPSGEKAEMPGQNVEDDVRVPSAEVIEERPIRERARARDGEDLQLRERRREGQRDGVRPPQSGLRAERRVEAGPGLRQGPRDGYGPGGGRGPGRWERPMNRGQAFSEAPRYGRGEGAWRGPVGPGEGRRAEGGMRRAPFRYDGVCPQCGCARGERPGGQGRGGPRGGTPRG